MQVPSYFSSNALTEIPNGSTVLPYPYPFYTGNVAMLWQIAGHMQFRIPGGEVYVPSPSRTSTNYPHGDLPPDVWDVLVQRERAGQSVRPWHAPSAAQRVGIVSDLRKYVASHAVDDMVVLASGAQGRWIAALAASAFGAPTRIAGAVSIWLKPVPS